MLKFSVEQCSMRKCTLIEVFEVFKIHCFIYKIYIIIYNNINYLTHRTVFGEYFKKGSFLGLKNLKYSPNTVLLGRTIEPEAK